MFQAMEGAWEGKGTGVTGKEGERFLDGDGGGWGVGIGEES